jgi:hypothetical protein
MISIPFLERFFRRFLEFRSFLMANSYSLLASIPPQISASMWRMYCRQTSSVTGPTPLTRDIA